MPAISPTLRIAAGLILTGLVLGTVSNAGLHPRRIPWVEDWTARTQKKVQEVAVKAESAGAHSLSFEEVLAIVQAPSPTHLIFDARKTELYDQGHLPTALSLPLVQFNDRFVEYHPILRKEDRILIYCSGRECDESIELARRLKSQGYDQVSVYLGGFDEWKAKGAPVE